MREPPRLLPPGATYHFTLRLAQQGSTLLTDNIGALRFAYARAVAEFPVTCHAMVVLPDHLHAIWTEPQGGNWYAERWRRIKTRFAQAAATPGTPLWQPRFQERALLDTAAFLRALDDCRISPVGQGLVSHPALWPYSSFSKALASAEA
jgi:putative transposase